MHAVDDLSDAIDVTRGFLSSLSLGSWLKLAVIIFFVSSLGFSGPSIPMGDVGMYTEDPTGEGFDEGFEEVQQEYEQETGEEFPVELADIIAALILIGLIMLGIYLIYALLAAIMEFVFIASLRSDEIHLRRYFRTNLGRGVRLFVFRIFVMALSGLGVFGTAYLVATSAGGFGELGDNAFIGLIALGFLVTLVYSVVMRYTSEFVAPIMLHEERGVLSSWSRFLSTFKRNWSEYIVYLLLVWVIQLVVTFAVWFVLGIVLLILSIPAFILLFLVLAFLAELGAIGGILAFVFVAFVFAVFVIVVSLVWAPVDSYFQYYALLLLGDTNEDLDLIPEQRALVRGDSSSLESTPGAGAAEGHDRDDTVTNDRDDTATDDRFESVTDEPADDEFDWYDADDGSESDVDGDELEDDDSSDTGGFYAGIDEDEDEDEDDDFDDRGW